MAKIRAAIRRIYNDRKELGKITQGDIAKRLGCNRSTISQYLNGYIAMSEDVIEGFCEVLGVNLSDLENWNPELAEIRFSAETTAEKAPPELAKAIAKLSRLYKANRSLFDGAVGTIEALLKTAKPGEAESREAAPDERPDAPKKQAAA